MSTAGDRRIPWHVFEAAPAAIAALVPLLICSCGSNGAPSFDTTSAPDADTCACSRLDAAPATSVEVSGVLFDWGSNKAIIGASACLLTREGLISSCSATDTIGRFTVDVPPGVPVLLQFNKPHYERAVIAINVQCPVNLDLVGIYPDSQAKVFFNAHGVLYPSGARGAIAAKCTSHLATARVVPVAGVGPVDKLPYEAGRFANATFNRVLKSRRSMILDLEPLTYTVSCVHPTRTCVPLTGWSTKTDTAKVPVIPGATSLVVFSCS